MPKKEKLEQACSDVESDRLLQQLFEENPILERIISQFSSVLEIKQAIKTWAMGVLKESQPAWLYYQGERSGPEHIQKNLRFKDIAAIRILDYIDHSGRRFKDLNLKGQEVENDPFARVVLCTKDRTEMPSPAFFHDMIHLFRQFSGTEQQTLPSKNQILSWMKKYPSGLDPDIIQLREINKIKILKGIIQKIETQAVKKSKFAFEENMSEEEKLTLAKTWWDDHKFHLRFAARTPGELNEMLGFSLNPDTVERLEQARKKGIPFFINPYYLSLLNTDPDPEGRNLDLTIRQYVLYSKELIHEFGNIIAWEKEDVIEPGKPNAAGWIVPDESVHRRYPNVAILIPKTQGRACGGLCSVCQRMYGFQYGNLNFDLEKLKDEASWEDRLKSSLDYFETDSQLRDILITGGDALMSTNKSLKIILQNVYQMAKRKKRANKSRKANEQLAQIIRVRLGTRLPVWLPMRMNKGLIKILADFKRKASRVGVKQFVFQTHFESPLEITPESRANVKKLNAAGWVVTNQLVFTSAASRRGHTAKLRKVLNDIGILPYYSFTVKGFMENFNSFTPNSRIVQESIEEKSMGRIPEAFHQRIKLFPSYAETIAKDILQLRKDADLPFLSTDRNVLNLPGVGKSLTFRTIGITHDGRRILEFDHDATREHSPIIAKMGKIAIIESKSIYDYLNQVDSMGENIQDYTSVYGYSLSETEARMTVFEYPEYDYPVTEKITHLEISRD